MRRIWLPALAASLALSACRGRFDALDDFTRRTYVDIYRPFFERVAGPDGRAVYRSRREGSLPSSFPAEKAGDVERVFVVGGSVAYELGLTPDLRKALEAAFPSKRLELVDCGMLGYDSYRDALIVREVLSYRPDLVILMSGNNEFYAPVAINVPLYRLAAALGRMPGLAALARALRPAPPGLSREERLAQFSANLAKIGAAARERGARLVYCTLPAGARLPPADFSALRRDPRLTSAWLSVIDGRPREALATLREYSLQAPAVYALGLAEEELGDWAAAARDYRRSLDLQDNRCGPAKNEAIRRAARRYGVLADLEAAFASHGEHGLTGAESMIDGVHWYEELNGFAAAVIAAAAAGPGTRVSAPVFVHASRAKARREVVAAARAVTFIPQGRRDELAVAILESAFRRSPEEADRLVRSPAALEAASAGSLVGFDPRGAGDLHCRLLEHAAEALRRLGRRAGAFRKSYNEACIRSSSLSGPSRSTLTAP